MKQPNFLFVFTDQQSAHMMSCAGNPYVKTPAMDGLAETGVLFERAYCTNPVCVPSRFSLLTGRMPSVIGLRSNETKHIYGVPERIKKTGLGWLLKRVGYETAYGGKVHLPKLNPGDLGFECICDDERDKLAKVSADFLKAPHEKPFILVASFINPHDICYMAVREFGDSDYARSLVEQGAVELKTLDEALKLPVGVGEDEFFARYCPPLPANFAPQLDEPEAIAALQAQRPFKKRAREEGSEKWWRLHRWAYARLTEIVDRQIGIVLDALTASGRDKDTIVIFTSDHGDLDAAHRMEHKTALYEEACRVPLIIRDPAGGRRGRVNDRLVSNGLDILPTLCDYAGAACPADLAGWSLRPLIEGKRVRRWRRRVRIESEFGRAEVGRRYKRVTYDSGRNREQLYDLKRDPGETRNHPHSNEG